MLLLLFVPSMVFGVKLVSLQVKVVILVVLAAASLVDLFRPRLS